jgi:hypothetical protein
LEELLKVVLSRGRYERLALSVIGGVAIPFVLAITLGPLSNYTENRTLRLVMGIPTGWPRLLYFRLFPPYARDSFAENKVAFLLFILVCDIALYTLITYCALSIWAFRKKSRLSELPPPPLISN